MAKKLKEFTIRRKKWLRGSETKEYGEATLRNDAGAMCCLGFFARACGVPVDELVGCAFPSDVRDQGDMPNSIYDAEKEIAKVNDGPHEDREKTLTKMFKKIGYKPIFV